MPQTQEVIDGSLHPGVPLGWQQSPEHAPQSWGQLAQLSPSSHDQLPHCAWVWHVPQPNSFTSATQNSSHPSLQQKGSCAQTQLVIPALLHPGVPLGWQQSPVHEPQSEGQLAQLSPSSHDQFPHTGPASQEPHPNCETSATHCASHSVSQHQESCPQTQLSMPQSSHPG